MYLASKLNTTIFFLDVEADISKRQRSIRKEGEPDANDRIWALQGAVRFIRECDNAFLDDWFLYLEEDGDGFVISKDDHDELDDEIKVGGFVLRAEASKFVSMLPRPFSHRAVEDLYHSSQRLY